MCSPERDQVSEKKDIAAIEKMLLELGETELELGEINEQEYLIQHKLDAASLRGMDVEEAEPVLPEEEAIGGEAARSADEDDFQELLKDIEIGLTEEQELQESFIPEEEAPSPPEIEPIEEIPITEAPPSEETPLQTGETVSGPEQPSVIEEIPGLEELLGEKGVAAQPEALPDQFEELLVSEEQPAVSEEAVLPEELLEQALEPVLPEESTEQLEEPVFPEEAFGEGFEEPTLEEKPPEEPFEEPSLEEKPPEEPSFGEEPLEEAVTEEEVARLFDVQVPEEEQPPEDQAVAAAAEPIDDSALDLPIDFDIEDIVAAEKTPPAGGVVEQEAEQGGAEQAPLEKEEEPVEVPEPVEEDIFPAPREESISIDESTVELEGLLFQKPGEEQGAPPQEERISEGLPSIDEIESEPARAEEESLPEGEVMELSEEDIAQIKTKLSTMSPVVAAAVQDIIVKSSLPAESMNGIVELLILDAPERDIIGFVERVTGKKIVVPPTRRPTPVVARKPGVLGALAENIGPFVRASMLVGAILIVLAALFFVFFWNPYNAVKYYRQAVLNVEKNDWVQVSESLDEAASFQDKSPQFYHGIKQYDNLGWKLMLAGQYSMAEKVFERGVLKELDKNHSIQNVKGVRNSRIFMRLAILYNILGRHADSEEMYAFVLNDLGDLKSSLYETDELNGVYQRPYIVRLLDKTDFIQRQKRSLRDYRRVESEEDRLRKTDEVTLLVAERIAHATSLNSTEEYDFRMLRGENLIDELSADGADVGGKDERRDDVALAQFLKAAELKKGEAVPLFKQLQVLIRRDDRTAVSSLTSQIERRFQKSRDEEVQTELAAYLVGYEDFTIVRQLLLKALDKRGTVYPFPPAYVTFGDYYKAVGNKALREEYLLAAVEAESRRVLPHRWNFRDRMLVSWTDYRIQRLKGKSDEEQAPQTAGSDVEFLFPWDETNMALLSYAYNGLGEIYAQGDTFENVAMAIRYFRKAIDPDAGPRAEDATFNAQVPEATFSLAQLYFYRVKDYSKALKLYRAYERALDENRFRNVNGSAYSPYVNDLYYNLGFLYYNQIQKNKQQNLNKALQYWSKLESLLPDNPHLQMAIGNTLLHKGAYESALGRYLYLAEVYDRLVDGLGEIKPWQDYDRRILGEAAAVYNNLGVAYQKLNEHSPIDNYQQNSLVALYKAGEYADILGEGRGNIQYNIYYIIHPDVVRSDMKINDELSDDYRFSIQ